MWQILVKFYLLMALTGLNLAAETKPMPVAKKPALPAKKAVLTPAQLATAVQKKYDQIKSAKLHFEQTYSHQVLAEQKSTGDIFFKPSKMRWSYDNPKKEFFINGKDFTYYRPGDKIAFRHSCFEQDSMTASLAFMGGKGKVIDLFNITAATDPTLNKTIKWISLSPKQKNAPATAIMLGVTDAGDVLESIVIDATGGKNHFKFVKREINVAIPDATFVFVKKEGDSVEPMPNVDCAPKAVVPVAPKAVKPPVMPAPKVVPVKPVVVPATAPQKKGP